MSRAQAAEAVDRAMEALGQAYRAYAALEGPVQRGIAARAALFHWAGELAEVMDLGKVRVADRRPLGESER